MFARSTHSRRLLPVAAAVLLSLTVGACSSNSSDVAEADSADTIRFSYDGYEVDIPQNPERVVVLDSRGGLEFALLADYPIVATAYNEDSHLNAYLPDDVGQVTGETEPDREAILSYAPDLLVVSDAWYEYYRNENIEVTDIAPLLVVSVPDGSGVVTDSLAVAQEQLEQLGRTERNAEAVADFDDAFEAARSKYVETVAGKTIALTGLSDTGWWALTSDSELTVNLSAALGLTILHTDTIKAAEAANDTARATVLGWEQAEELNGADMILAQNLELGDGQPTWDRIPAVAAGNVHRLDYEDRSGFALTYQDFLGKLTAALDGLISP